MTTHTRECGPDCLGPDCPGPDFIECMERALAGPRWTIPQGLSPEEIGAYITDCADGKIPPDGETK